MSKLLPCPFCGCHHPKLEKEGALDFYWYVRCPICNTRKGRFYTKEEAISDWNKRN